jgi:hypothetical protein
MLTSVESHTCAAGFQLDHRNTRTRTSRNDDGMNLAPSLGGRSLGRWKLILGVALLGLLATPAEMTDAEPFA